MAYVFELAGLDMIATMLTASQQCEFRITALRVEMLKTGAMPALC